MHKDFLISICIPTRDRVDILRETLQSILIQNVDAELYEICVSDNSPSDETKEFLQKEFGSISNLTYKKSDCEGFLNSVEALKLGHGKLLKLHNDYSKFLPGSLQQIIDSVKDYELEKPEIFFALDSIKTREKLTEQTSFDDFLNVISYYSTWSSAFSIWKSDFDELMEQHVGLDGMFPHTSLLFALTDKKKYVVNNYEYVENLPLKKKGGYNLIDNFVRIYLNMVLDLLKKNHISQETYKKIEHEIIKFSAKWYAIVKTDKRFTFTFENKENLIKSTCGWGNLCKFEFYFIAWYYPKLLLRKTAKQVCHVSFRSQNMNKQHK